jgi:hypothetical protein
MKLSAEQIILGMFNKMEYDGYGWWLAETGLGDGEIEHANDFLNKPPLSGEKVLAERLAKLQAARRATAVPVELQEPAANAEGGVVVWNRSLGRPPIEAKLYTEQQVIDILKSVGVAVKP